MKTVFVFCVIHYLHLVSPSHSSYVMLSTKYRTICAFFILLYLEVGYGHNSTNSFLLSFHSMILFSRVSFCMGVVRSIPLRNHSTILIYIIFGLFFCFCKQKPTFHRFLLQKSVPALESRLSERFAHRGGA